MTSPAAASRAQRTWPEFDRDLYAWELANTTLRATQIYFDGDGAPEHFSGTYSECGVSHGAPGLRLSTGEIIEI